MTIDDNTARSYQGTVYSNWMGHSWTARIAVETVNTDPKNTLFFGLGSPVPNEGANNEPRDGQSVYVYWQSGASNSKIKVNRNGTDVVNTQTWQGDPGYDILMTYNHLTKQVQFEVDNWNGGRGFGDEIDVTCAPVSIDGFLTNTNEMHIFFGANGKVTFGDFEVYEIEASALPPAPENLYAWPETNNSVTVYWDEAALATGGYCVYRSVDDVETNYVQIATNVMDTSFTDTAVTVGVTYYYKASAVSPSGEGALSGSEFSVPNKYNIFGVMHNSSALETRWFYELFDRNLDTFCDDNASGGYAGLDYGAGNNTQVLYVSFRLRNDSFGSGDDGTLVVDGVTNSVTRSQNGTFGATFEGSNDGATWTEFAAITNIAAMGEWNQLTVTDTTAYRYVRYNSAPSGWNNYVMADVEFLTAADFTAKGTPILWLEEYGLTEADDEVDTDLDGLKNWEEYIAGTDPTDSASVLELNSITVLTNGFVLTWQSVEGKSYSVITNSSLMFSQPGVIVSDIQGLSSETSYTTTVSEASSVFYEIGVE
ncbi:MAG: hypothetical protein V5783_00980 [Pontiella sp.]